MGLEANRDVLCVRIVLEQLWEVLRAPESNLTLLGPVVILRKTGGLFINSINLPFRAF